ncbi:hypothetical protein EXIGLDRAFT_752165 [Exidia glandulosa HHB12029]|uniref:CST complex subunit STN1 n=1 Tax=Exidia glandulosa HHB12029 TaxID=1314781 RepID=A0A166A123_EXIGL|nr:hypothetical protein EXIGLDRAFT_752165 [Exidia glandulosa HHB12029]
MSQTCTTATTSNAIASTSRLLLTPRKPAAARSPRPLEARRAAYRYTFSAASTAPVLARDVHELVEDRADEQRDTFFWLGTNPVRTVTVVGVVVDTWQRETIIGFSIDDGTATIECTQRHKSPTPSHLPWVGDTVRATGKVYVRRRGGDKEHKLEVEHGAWSTVAAGVEPLHVLNVLRMHTERYSKPFDIPTSVAPPPPPTQPASPVKSQPATPSTSSIRTPETLRVSRIRLELEKTPTKNRRPPLATSAWAPAPAPSLTSTLASTQAPSQSHLTHPANLRTKQRTRNTFRIYVKAYMCASPSQIRAGEGGVFGLPHPKDGSKSVTSVGADVSITSTLPSESQARWSPVRTPQAKRRRLDTGPDNDEEQTTPRASALADDSATIGFTRAFLESVPELAQLASAVARVERHLNPKPTTRPHTREEKEASDAQAGREIFLWAIRSLMDDGAIVLHHDEGPVWSRSTSNSSITVLNGGTQDAFVPVTNDLLREPVREIVRALKEKAKANGKEKATADQVLRVMKRDDRWRCLGVWDVQAVLDEGL